MEAHGRVEQGQESPETPQEEVIAKRYANATLVLNQSLRLEMRFRTYL